MERARADWLYGINMHFALTRSWAGNAGYQGVLSGTRRRRYWGWWCGETKRSRTSSPKDFEVKALSLRRLPTSVYRYLLSRARRANLIRMKRALVFIVRWRSM
ncbi:hypothetical protein KCP78_04825 [Salmonella enterica subsp. enterica]|nr:hypothetical protein KCP78_04825 [Salmonella enterica subsp. enterica]